jgi:hypothetical protein
MSVLMQWQIRIVLSRETIPDEPVVKIGVRDGFVSILVPRMSFLAMTNVALAIRDGNNPCPASSPGRAE